MAQVKVAERATRRDVGERIALAMAPRAITQLARQLCHAFADLAPLPVDPFVALEMRRTPALDDDRRRRVANTVRQGFPFLDGDPLSSRLGNEPRYRTDEIDVLDDDARIVQMRAVVENEHRQLAERVVRVNGIAGIPRRRGDDLVLDLLFRERDANLPRIGTRRGGDQFQHGRRCGAGGQYADAHYSIAC